jgi:hypothetical protein
MPLVAGGSPSSGGTLAIFFVSRDATSLFFDVSCPAYLLENTFAGIKGQLSSFHKYTEEFSRSYRDRTSYTPHPSC